LLNDHSIQRRTIVHIQTNSNYPVVNERNKQIHVPTAVGQVAIYHGHATEVVPARRGTNEYLAQRAALNAPLVAPKVSWSVRITAIAKRTAIVASCSNGCNINFRYEDKAKFADSVVFTHSCGQFTPESVPASVVKQYRSVLEQNPLAAYTADEAAVISESVREVVSKSRGKIWQGNRDEHGEKLLLDANEFAR
jgi:acetyltransferase-like isoleucine patch superfamily enzyme